jgi:hypothetical protein
MPPSVDDEGASAEARRYLDAHRSELRLPVDDADLDAGTLVDVGVDAGADAGAPSGDCVSGLERLAADVAIAVISRGHAGGDSAAEVQINPGACFERVVVVVVLTAGAWHAVRAIAFDDESREVARIGDDVEYSVYTTVGSSDHDFGSDEFF